MLNAVLGTEGSRFFLNARDENGCTALHKAAANGFVEVVQLLLTAGAKVCSACGATPLQCDLPRHSIQLWHACLHMQLMKHEQTPAGA